RGHAQGASDRHDVLRPENENAGQERAPCSRPRDGQVGAARAALQRLPRPQGGEAGSPDAPLRRRQVGGGRAHHHLRGSRKPGLGFVLAFVGREQQPALSQAWDSPAWLRVLVAARQGSGEGYSLPEVTPCTNSLDVRKARATASSWAW